MKVPEVFFTVILLTFIKANESTVRDEEPKFYRYLKDSLSYKATICFDCRIQARQNNTLELVTLVGLFRLHTGPNCDKIVSVKNYNGFQRMEAFVLALKEINSRDIEEKQVFIEAIIYDSCSDELALQV